ncbi:hypothetical protein [Flavisolibacter tropicus]|uniref:Uncharacterized protein n=1 Tax=Flavisolibacter tropicus TaxID=1492898 RepID=A0A172TQE3_9BACT|nr:hypothetical protein [Flavisolibacter tropicus]ANE49289.1 hypothetical protein SY85_01000 [Flavisolibacter tropicus]
MEPQVIIEKIQEQFPQVIIAKNRSYGMYNYIELEWNDEQFRYVTSLDIYANQVKPYGFIRQFNKIDKDAKTETIGTHPLVDEIIKTIKRLQ